MVKYDRFYSSNIYDTVYRMGFASNVTYSHNNFLVDNEVVMLNWKQSERELGYCIVEMLLERDNDHQELTAEDIRISLKDTKHNAYYVTPLLRSLKLNHRELTQPRGDYTPYKLSANGYLSILLSLRRKFEN